jgi:hypothetical protein
MSLGNTSGENDLNVVAEIETSASRTEALIGTVKPPSLGKRDVVQLVLPNFADTGITPQP